MVDTYQANGLGYLPDLYSSQDYAPDNPEVKDIYSKISGLKTSRAETERRSALPDTVDLRKSFTPIMDQGSLGSCTSHASAGLIQYFEKKAFGSYTDLSRRFIYKITRNLLHWTGDTGAFLRTAMGTLTLFGAPPEEFWPYDIKNFDIEPSAFCYSFAENYRAIKYVRLDQPNLSTNDLLRVIKSYLVKGLPSMFGFTCYESLWQSKTNGGSIPFFCKKERMIGGHAILVAGYDDNKRIKNSLCDNETTGAFLIRNSWGTAWGENGYGWFPYEYILKGIALDWWTIIKEKWVDSGQFGEGRA
jgi:C1A family cysteine protease